MRELYRLIKSSIQEDTENTLIILDKCYQRGLKSYQKLTRLINNGRLGEEKLIKAERERESIKNSLNKILDSSINLRLRK